MKKRTIIGTSIAVVVFSVALGIASLPDEVLIESSSVGNPQIPIEQTQKITTQANNDNSPNTVLEKNAEVTKAELNSLKNDIKNLKNELKELKTSSEESNTEQISQQDNKSSENVDNESQGQVIRVSIKDGVGTSMR